jgi:hypothetical protein
LVKGDDNGKEESNETQDADEFYQDGGGTARVSEEEKEIE